MSPQADLVSNFRLQHQNSQFALYTRTFISQTIIQIETGESRCSTNRSEGIKIPSNQRQNSYFRFGLWSQCYSMREVERKKVGIGKRRIPTEH